MEPLIPEKDDFLIDHIQLQHLLVSISWKCIHQNYKSKLAIEILILVYHQSW